MREEPQPAGLLVWELNSPMNKVGSKEPLVITNGAILFAECHDRHAHIAVHTHIKLVTAAGAPQIQLFKLLVG